jgi:hypothetical protein
MEDDELATKPDPLAVRLATRFRIAIATLGAVVAATIPVSLFTGWVPTFAIKFSAGAIAGLATAFFLCGVFDRRFQNAVSVYNAEAWLSRRATTDRDLMTRLGLPKNNLLMFALLACLAIESTVAFNILNNEPLAMLGMASAFLVCMCLIGLVIRGLPDDHFAGVFGTGQTAKNAKKKSTLGITFGDDGSI